MNVEPHMQVLAIDDRRLGEAVAVRRCCFEVKLVNDPERISLTAESVFSVDTGRVTLVCGVGEIDRYVCVSHRK